MFFSCERVCRGRDPATDTVRISFTQDAADQALPTQADEALLAEAAAAAAVDGAQEDEERRRAEEDGRRRAEEEELRRREEEEELRRLAQLEAEARSRAEAEARQAELAAQRLREQEEESLRQERSAQVRAFLKAEGFAGVGASRRQMLRKTYPLHRAAELGNDKMIEYLLAEGADPAQKNSAGQTATQVATKKNSKGTHIAALRALGGA